ncbi:MAG: glycine--tRNA ligase [Candidatus Thermoplasmatota archaeon]|jgi:glycyl-tRNA synthetase|nr:glycine--tRNA ligase [Candidatus Thermoplasmatota archaeon]MCL5962849.1 glycine--tRNA ligase [Candidatus Thermoplasmatota archaeon]
MNTDEVISFAKRRGFFWQTAEIYGGLSGIYDYGHIGTLLKRNFENIWLSFFVNINENYYLIDCSNILPERSLISSGHTAHFNDMIVSCSKCHAHFRADQLISDKKIEVSEGADSSTIDEIIKKYKIVCTVCKSPLSMAKPFNLMFDLYLGPEKSDKAYLRPETAQDVYLNFAREFNILRKKLPAGLAIIGKAYRNEISPRQGLYRLRELIQAELQIFFNPDSWDVDYKNVADRPLTILFYNSDETECIPVKNLIEEHAIPSFYAYHLAIIDIFYKEVLKIPDDKFRFHEKGGDEKAFYNRIHMDIEVDIESLGGFREVGGVHYRGDYDLTSHAKGSMQDLSVSVGDKKIIPHVLELSFGVDRTLWMLLDLFYKKEEERTILKIPGYLSPYNAAILPLQNDLNGESEKIFRRLNPLFRVFYDTGGSIGRRYARMDEIGTPFCITVDYETVDKQSSNYNTVTVRYRDDKKQIRIPTTDIADFIRKNIVFNPSIFMPYTLPSDE